MKLSRLVNGIYVLIFLLVFFLALHSVFLESQWMILLALLPLGLLFTTFFRGKKKSRERGKKLNYDRLWYLVWLGSFALMLLVTFSCKVDFSWDWGRCLQQAEAFDRQGGVGDLLFYFARYPNIQFWFSCLICLARFVRMFMPAMTMEDFYNISIVLSSLFVSGAIYLIHSCGKILWGSRRGFQVGVLATLCLPLYVWAMFAYSDAPSMFLLTLCFYLYLKEKEAEKFSHKLVFCLLLGVASALAYQVKVTVFIVTLAILVATVLQLIREFSKAKLKKVLLKFVVLSLAFTLTYGISQDFARRTSHISQADIDAYKFPLTHWVMMSLRYGGFNQEDVDFTASFENYEERKEATVEEMEKRLKARSLGENLRFFFIEKQTRTWGNGNYASTDYSSRLERPEKNLIKEFVTAEGKWNKIYLAYTGIYHIILILGILLSGILAWRKDGDERMEAGRISLLGLAVFLLVWETNSRYLVAFLPMMIMVAYDGYEKLFWKKKRDK